ncbi:hypothetical protein SAMN05216308_10298 [Nitrosospira sp. Nsp13]|nr:hypothetical protein SAMN05216308_10298 [Nitrosospira sp. Nsp13]
MSFIMRVSSGVPSTPVLDQIPGRAWNGKIYGIFPREFIRTVIYSLCALSAVPGGTMH